MIVIIKINIVLVIDIFVSLVVVNLTHFLCFMYIILVFRSRFSKNGFKKLIENVLLMGDCISKPNKTEPHITEDRIMIRHASLFRQCIACFNRNQFYHVVLKHRSEQHAKGYNHGIAMPLITYLQFKSGFGWSLSSLVAFLRWKLFTFRDLWEWIDHPFDVPPLVPGSVHIPLPLTGLGQHFQKRTALN
jgi:hypothetical protein